MEPRNVVVSPSWNGWPVVTWNPIEEIFARGPFNNSYVIWLSRLSSAMTPDDVTVFQENGTRAILNGVSPDTWYKVEVAAVTVSETGKKLRGPFSKAIRIQTPAAAGIRWNKFVLSISRVAILFYRYSSTRAEHHIF